LQTKIGILNTEILILCIQQCLLHTHYCSLLYYLRVRLTGTNHSATGWLLDLNFWTKKRINKHRRNRWTTVQRKTIQISLVFDPVILLSYAYTYWNVQLIVTWQLLLTIWNLFWILGFYNDKTKNKVDYITRVLLKQEVWLTGRSHQEDYCIKQELKTLLNKIKTKIKFYRPFPHILKLLARRNQEIGKEIKK
jgi:hypothetical protein